MTATPAGTRGANREASTGRTAAPATTDVGHIFTITATYPTGHGHPFIGAETGRTHHSEPQTGRAGGGDVNGGVEQECRLRP
jgi:hypothetical protein